MVVFGLNTPEVKRVYMGYSEVEKPLSGLFKEDYKKVVGEREKKYHKAGWKMARFASFAWLMDRWLSADDLLIGEVTVEDRRDILHFAFTYLATAIAELLTNAFYAIQEGNYSKAERLLNEIKTIQEDLFNRMGLDDQMVQIDLYVDMSNWWYSCGVCVYKR